MIADSKKSRNQPWGQLIAVMIGAFLSFALAALFVKSIQSLTLARSTDEGLLEAFELVALMLVCGTLAMVFLGVVLRFVLPHDYAEEPFGKTRLSEIYAESEINHFSIESDRDHAQNPYRELPDLELCDVADQLDRDEFPDVWLDVAHEIKRRVELITPVRIG